MIPSNSLTIKEWLQFAEHIASSLVSIGHTSSAKHFARSRFPDLQTDEFDDLRSPALVVEVPESSGVDNSSSNLLVNRYLAYTIVVRLQNAGDRAELMNAELQAETIAMQVLARLRTDRIHKGGTVFGDVKMSQWEGDSVTPFLKENWAGYRIMVPVQVKDTRLTYDAGLWNDDDAPPLLRDLTGISCPNLNDPTMGLTTAQRLGCILPTYDFSDTATLAALTDDQEADLTAAYGDGGSGTVDVVILVDGVSQGTIPNVPTNVDQTITVTL